MNRRAALRLLACLTAPGCAVPAWGAEAQRFASGPARVALLELFTSEGCSSCPPAEQWLGALREDAGLWKTFVPIAWHVNYWDRLGWPDRFASREATQREYAYAEAWGSGNVYTPCFVRDGIEWRARGRTIEANGSAVAGTLNATYDGAVVRAEFAPAVSIGGRRAVGAGKENGGDGAPPSDSRNARTGEFEIHAVLLGGGIVSKVTAGENRGETLSHEFVALAQAHGAPGKEIRLPRQEAAGVARYALAVWVTQRGRLIPLQAAGGWVDF